MANLTGSFAAKMASTFPFQSSIFLLPWSSKVNSGVRCLGRDYGSSSGPVRYIPKKGTKGRNQESLSAGVPDAIDGRIICNGNARRFEVTHKEVSERSWARKEEFPDFKSNQVPEKNFRIDSLAAPANQYKQDSAAEETTQILDDVDVDYIEIPKQGGDEIVFQPKEATDDGEMVVAVKGRKDAEETAVQLLATRAYTAVELKKKLRGKQFPSSIVESLINDFQIRGLINDSLYAEAFSRSKWSSSCWGPVRIKHELYKKGVCQGDAENAVKLVFQESDSNSGQQSSGQALSKMSLEHLYAQASKQWNRNRGVPSDTRKSRIVRWLQYRGFNWGVITIILRKLERQASFEGD